MMLTSFPNTDLKSSMLGFGAMRLPTIDGEINEPEAIAMIRRAIDGGVRYVDTAYVYHGQKSEGLVGKALKDGYREKVIVATKLPVWMAEKPEDLPRMLDEQLERLGVDCIDLYLMHALNKDRLAQLRKLGYKEFLDKAQAEGKIRYPAFSFHDNKDAFLEILNDYDWKMCQVQMNILDHNTQATLDGIRIAGEKGVGVVIMEPLRGGMLANPPADVQALYDAFPVKRSAAEWSFRFLYTNPHVKCILSGMSTMEQVEDNLRIFDAATADPLTAEEIALLDEVRETYMRRTKTRCTACSYCQPCPMGVVIPQIFQAYDWSKLRNNDSFGKRYQEIIAAEGDASRCVQCGACEAACPQHLPIIQYLQEIHAEAE